MFHSIKFPGKVCPTPDTLKTETFFMIHTASAPDKLHNQCATTHCVCAVQFLIEFCATPELWDSLGCPTGGVHTTIIYYFLPTTTTICYTSTISGPYGTFRFLAPVKTCLLSSHNFSPCSTLIKRIKILSYL